jgi:hypothetical protein
MFEKYQPITNRRTRIIKRYKMGFFISKQKEKGTQRNLIYQLSMQWQNEFRQR